MSSVKLCLFYAHEDDKLGQTLEKYLRLLKRKAYPELDLWSLRDISAGAQREHEIDSHLKAAHIILLLLSPDFFFHDMDSQVVWTMERREDRGVCVIIPILLRDVGWDIAFLKGLQVLPKDGKAITTWKQRDKAWSTVVADIQEVIEKLVDREKPTPNASVNEISMFRPLAEEDETPFMFYPGVAHLGPVTCVLFARDGETLVSSDGMDHTINIWDVSRRQVQRQILGHSDQIYSIALSRDMHTLTSAGQESTVRIWNFQTGQERRPPLEGHLGPISSVAISRDGKILASAGDDGTIRTWNLPTGQVHRPPLAACRRERSSISIPGDLPTRVWFIAQVGIIKQSAVAGRIKTVIVREYTG